MTYTFICLKQRTGMAIKNNYNSYFRLNYNNAVHLGRAGMQKGLFIYYEQLFF